MVAPRPALDQIFSENSIRPSLDDLFMLRNRPPAEEIRARNNSDYISEQFGVNPKTYNPLSGIHFGPFAPSAKQPGSALPIAGQAVGNVVGAGMGVPGSVVGGMAGALGGEVVRQGIGGMFGVQDPSQSIRQFKDLTKRAAFGEATGVGFNLASRPLRAGAERIMWNYLRPSTKLAKEHPNIASKALDFGVGGNQGRALGRIERMIGERADRLNEIIKQNPDARVSMKNAFGYLDDEIAKARFAQADEQVLALEALKQQFIDDYLVPTFGEKEVAQFVMRGPSSPGPARYSTQVTPQKTSFSVRKMSPSQRREAGMIGGKGPRIVTEKTSLESPTDIIAMKQSGKRGVAVTPKTTRQILPEVRGESRKQIVRTGQKMRPVSVEEAQLRKQAQYENLTKRRAGGGYGADTKSTDITGRQAYARGLKDDIVDVLGGEATRLNADMSSGMAIREALTDRIPVNMRNDIISLSDSVLGGMAYSNPKVLGLMTARKLLKNPLAGSGMAHSLNAASHLGSPLAMKSSNPLIRALIANEYGRYNLN